MDDWSIDKDALLDLLSTKVAVQGFLHWTTLIKEYLLFLLSCCLILAPALRVLLDEMLLVIVSAKGPGEVLDVGRDLVLGPDFRLSSEVDTEQAFT